MALKIRFDHQKVIKQSQKGKNYSDNEGTKADKSQDWHEYCRKGISG